MMEMLDLDFVIELEKSLMDEEKDFFKRDLIRFMVESLTELKQRRESDLRPADKFLGATIGEQFDHVASEFEEVEKEIYPSKIATRSVDKIVEELIDLQMSCETMLAILGLDEQQRREARRKVISKNEARGYYWKGGKNDVRLQRM